MSKVNTKIDFVELHELEDLDLHTTTVDGKRFYVDTSGEMYPSVTTVTSLLSADQIKLWRKRVGEETANRISNAAARRGTAFHYKVEDYLRREKEYVELSMRAEDTTPVIFTSEAKTFHISMVKNKNDNIL